MSDPVGVTAHRRGALERVQLLLADWTLTHQRIAETETRMTAVLDELGLTELVTSIPRLSPVGAAGAARNRACASPGKMFAALTDPAGVTAHRRGALERVQLLLADWDDAHRRLADTAAPPSTSVRTHRGRCGGAQLRGVLLLAR